MSMIFPESGLRRPPGDRPPRRPRGFREAAFDTAGGVVVLTLSASEVAAWFDAAKGGDAKAQFVLGRFYLDGLAGIPRDVALARRWFFTAAAPGSVSAQIELARIHASGIGGVPDQAEAASWYRAAAERGHSGAQRVLGTLYWRGVGVGRDPDQAATWWRKAADQGDSIAKKRLAPLLWRGQFMPRDRRLAWRYLREVAVDPRVWPLVERTASYRRGVLMLWALILVLALVVGTCGTLLMRMR